SSRLAPQPNSRAQTTAHATNLGKTCHARFDLIASGLCYCSWASSPPSTVERSRYACAAIESRTNRTEPSANVNCSPPGCRLRNEYRCGQSLYGSYSPPLFGFLFQFGGTAVVPPTPLAYGH